MMLRPSSSSSAYPPGEGACPNITLGNISRSCENRVNHNSVLGYLQTSEVDHGSLTRGRYGRLDGFSSFCS